MEIPEEFYPDCKLLTRHLKKYFELFVLEKKPEDMGLIEAVNAEIHFINNGANLEIYAGFEKNFKRIWL